MRKDFGWRVNHYDFQRENGIDLTPEQERTINEGLNDIATIERGIGKAQGAMIVIGTGLLIYGLGVAVTSFINYKLEKNQEENSTKKTTE